MTYCLLFKLSPFFKTEIWSSRPSNEEAKPSPRQQFAFSCSGFSLRFNWNAAVGFAEQTTVRTSLRWICISVIHPCVAVLHTSSGSFASLCTFAALCSCACHGRWTIFRASSVMSGEIEDVLRKRKSRGAETCRCSKRWLGLWQVTPKISRQSFR